MYVSRGDWMTTNTFSSYIIGSGTLPIHCAELLLERGHEIFGIISSDTRVARWAARRNIEHIPPQADLLATLGRHPFDYLFSIANPHMLHEQIVTMPNKFAVNYHDALLPHYAGTYPTSWALMHQECTHGITWHVMAREIDTVAALKQQVVGIEPGETAFTLNAKCYQAAIESFAVLIEELAAGQETTQKLNVDDRSEHPVRKRPDAGGVIDWDQDAKIIDAFVRALDFGPYPNPLGLPKAAIGQDFIVIPVIEVLDQRSDEAPGRIVAITSDSLRVSTATSDIIIRKACTADGVPLAIPDLVSKYRLEEGYGFEPVDPQRADRITSFHAAICRHEQFWADRLAQLQPVELAFCRQREQLQRPRYDTASIHIPEALRRLPDSGDIILAAFVCWLGRIGGVSSFDVGFRDIGLSRETAGLEGMFAPCVPLHIELDMEKGIRDAVDSIRAGIRLVQERRTYMRDLSARCSDVRSIPEMPDGSLLRVVVEQVKHLKDCSSTVAHQIRLVMPEEGTECWWTYDTGILDKESVTRMIRQFSELLQGVLENPDCPVGKLPLLAAAEIHQLLVDWNQTASEYPRNECVHQLLERQAERTPEVVAIISETDQLTYRELNQRSNQLAYHLCALGVGPDIPVAVCMERSSRMLVALFGILKAGGAYIPLDPSHPSERLEYMLADAAVPVLLTEERLLQQLPASKAKVLCLDSSWDAVAKQSIANLSPRSCPENLAYIIYTSGSTGKPKGVQVRHGAVVNFLFSMHQEPGFSADDVMLAITTISFDIAGLELYLPLLVGGRVVMTSTETAADGVRLAELMERSGATVMQGTPATWQLLLVAGWRGNPRLKVLCGGEALSRDLAQQLLPRCAELWNLYGPTETTIWSTIAKIDIADEKISIGRPVANTEIYILDSRLQLVPAGVSGELYIGGSGLARGYLNRPELTADRFIAHPYSSDPHARLYKTGDLARYWPDGRIEHLGRLDFQVKLRGFRIELGEIESALRAHPSVREAVVTIREDRPGDRQLVAYVTAGPDQPFSPSDLRTELRRKLPDYMVPSSFVVLGALPLTPNGKIDRRALPAPERRRADSDAGFAAPATEVERTIASIWRETLRLEEVGRNDNFFDLGGHSLLAMQIVSRIQRILHVELGVRRLFERPTVAELAEEIEGNRVQSGAVLPLVAANRDGRLPLSYAQERLWFLDQLEPNSAGYNIAGGIRLKGPLDAGALEDSLNALLTRHEALRTIFVEDQGRPSQVIVAEQRLKLVMEDLRGIAGGEKRIQQRAQAEGQRPFNLREGPLVRVALLRTAEEEHFLLVTMHHIVSDGWSLGIFQKELGELYAALTAGKSSPLTPLPIQYADYAIWQRGWLQGEILEKQLDYWRQQLAGAPPVSELPTDHPRPALQTFNGTVLRYHLPKRLTEEIRKLSRQQGVTLFMTLLSAFKLLLYRYSHQADIVIGTPIANRNRLETEGMIGFFVNTLLLRTQFSEEQRFTDVMAQMREVTLGAYAHQDLPFEKLVEVLQPERSLSHNPLFQVMFVFQNVSQALQKYGGIEWTHWGVDTGTSKFDLTLSVAESSESLDVWLEYNTDLFEEGTMQRLLGHYQRLLEQVVVDPGRQILRLSLLTEAEARQLLVDWNRTGADYPQDKGIHQLFEARAEQAPDEMALVFDHQEMTYGELNRRANRLAHHLQRHGVGPEVLVGICVSRSLEMVIGILGILKAGGAYVPLDPSYPSARLSMMMEDSRAPVLLTQRELKKSLPTFNAHVIFLDEFQDETRLSGKFEVENPKVNVAPGNLAYVIYTSGSTGKPKGVMIEHGGVCNLAESFVRILNIRPGDRVLQFSSLSFDASVPEIFATFAAGATLVLCRLETLMPGLPLLRLLRDQRITLVTLPPSALAALESADLPALERLIVAGEACTAELVDRWSTRHRFFNAYGPTEVTVCATIAECRKQRGAPPIGRPLGNKNLYVLDSHQQPVPLGVAGELCIGGVGLARGYLNRPELTAEKFIPNPWGSDSSDRLYRSGDLVRYREDGNLEFLGRIDQQVKIRGFRIELGEIEEVLSRVPGVRQVAVVAREDVPGDKRLVGYVVADGEAAPAASKLKEWLRGNLPEYMVPSGWVFMPELPLMPNGKIDRRALPKPDESRAGLREEYVAPRTAVEEVLAGIWAEVLGLEKVGVHDNFFELGGHSLLATRAMARMNETLHIEIPLRRLFETPTAAGIAAALLQDPSARNKVEKRAQLLLRIAELSTEEIQRMLAARTSASVEEKTQ
jgi:amino acid adenylation domain-containing protein